jgi:hypothetical protein
MILKKFTRETISQFPIESSKVKESNEELQIMKGWFDDIYRGIFTLYFLDISIAS